MKKLLYFLAALTAISLISCSRIWDFINYDIKITVTDNAGNDLLDPGNENGIPWETIWVEYKGEKFYPADEIALTRENIPVWNGLRIEAGGGGDSGYALLFGEFSPSEDHRGTTLTLHLGEDSEYSIKFDLYITWFFGKPTVHRKIWLDAEIISAKSFEITIVK